MDRRLVATPAGAALDGAPSPLSRARAAAERKAIAWSAQPAQALLALLGAGALIAAAGIPLGLLIADDQAAVFREMMPGTWLSFAEFLAIAAAASAAHRVVAGDEPWHRTFWGLTAGIAAALAFVEIAQPTVFVAHWLRDHAGVATPFGLADLDAAILVGMLMAIAIALLVRIRPLLAHPRALVLLGIGGVLGAASQGLDATFAATRWEFVAEESLKLTALPFVLGGYLLVLGALRREHEHDA